MVIMQYEVFLDGEPLKVYPCCTSGVPFNRVWPGHQRDKSQTEISYFVSFDMESPVTLSVKFSGKTGKKVEIRPKEYGIPFEITDSTAEIKLDRPLKFTFEVNGRHEALHVFANRKHNYTVDENTLYFGPGVHDAGVIFPQSGQTVLIDEGAYVYGAVFCYKVDNVKIVGRGILDSSKIRRYFEIEDKENDEWLNTLKKVGLSDSLRDIQYWSAFTAYGCHNLTVEGIIMLDAPLWVMIIRNHCKNVKIENVKIVGQWRYNSDGIDLCASSDCTVNDCFVRAYDDCIVVRGNYIDGEAEGCENITVTNNVLWCDWGKALEIWSGHKDSTIKKVLFKGNSMIRLCFHAISIDTWYGSRKITVENISYEDNTVDTTDAVPGAVQQSDDDVFDENRTAHPDLIYIAAGKFGRYTDNQQFVTDIDTSDYKVTYKDIHFTNLKVIGEKIPVTIKRDNIFELSDITFHNCDTGDWRIL